LRLVNYGGEDFSGVTNEMWTSFSFGSIMLSSNYSNRVLVVYPNKGDP